MDVTSKAQVLVGPLPQMILLSPPLRLIVSVVRPIHSNQVIEQVQGKTLTTWEPSSYAVSV